MLSSTSLTALRLSAAVAISAVCALLVSAHPAVASPNSALIQNGLSAMKRGDFYHSCESFATAAARTKDFTVGIKSHAAMNVNLDPSQAAAAAQKFATVPAEACTFEYIAAMIAVEKNDSVATRSYTQQAAAYARDAGISAAAPSLAAPARAVASTSGSAGSAPLGDYACSDANTAVAGSGAYGTMTHYIGSDRGNIWLLDAHTYAGPYSANDRGVYEIRGNKFVVLKGGYKGWDIDYAPPANGRPAGLHINLTPTQGLWCVWRKSN